MKNIEVKVLNPWAVLDAEQMLATTARITQRSEKIADIQDFISVYEKEFTASFLHNMCQLPHPTIQKFGLINVVVVGASRRFLAQITRHQNEIKFMSGSLQYSDYSGKDNKTDFVVPYNYYDTPMEQTYLDSCKRSYEDYTQLVKMGNEQGIFDAGDAAGYAMSQGLRNVLIMSATPFQWKYMIGLRSCNRNTVETQYVLLKIWEQLYNISPMLFGKINYGCLAGKCEEGSMACFSNTQKHPRKPLGKDKLPAEILAEQFSKIYVPDGTVWTRDAMTEKLNKLLDMHYRIYEGTSTYGFNLDKCNNPELVSQIIAVLDTQFKK